MNETKTMNCPYSCPPTCPGQVLLNIATSIAHQEDALACILNAECAKINKIVNCHDNDHDYDERTGNCNCHDHDDNKDCDGVLADLLAINNSVNAILQQITALEGVLKAKLDSILPFLDD